MIDQSPYIGSRPMPLTEDQVQRMSRAEAGLEVLAWMMAVALMGFAGWLWAVLS